jgi:hypothetical protein
LRLVYQRASESKGNDKMDCYPEVPKVSPAAALQQRNIARPQPQGIQARQVQARPVQHYELPERIVRVHVGPPASVTNNYTTNVTNGAGPQGFETTISVPAATWVIPHTLGRRPDVAVYDSAGMLMIADVQSSLLFTTVTFAVPTTGSVVLS